MGVISVISALVSNGVAFGTAVGAALGLGTIGTALLRLGGSLLLSAAVQRLGQNTPRASEIRAQLFQPTATPAYRDVYGEYRAAGTPVAYPVVNGHIYGYWLVNSRPSAGPFVLYLDGRAVEMSGDPYDFAGAGAVATNEPFVGHVSMWIQRGDEVSPPAVFTAEAGQTIARPELYLTTDGCQGRTVVWLKLRAGDNGRRSERWPANPPQVQLEGRFSRVWDPRDEEQNADNPHTWMWSENQALCMLDYVRNNPIEPWPLDLLEVDTFIDCADVAAEAVALNGGGTEPRYTVGCVVLYAGGEFEDLAAPLIIAGASDMIRVGGKLGMAPGAWRAPVLTTIDFLPDAMTFTAGKPGDATPGALRVTYASADRGYETAELAEWSVPGGGTKVETLALDAVTSPTQAARVRNIIGKLRALQRGIEGVEFPQAIKATCGDVVTVDLPDPVTLANGTYRIKAMHPAFLPISTDPDRLSMRIPMVLEETAESVYAHNPATDEPEVVDLPYDGTRQGVARPGAITVNRADLDTGGTVVPRLKFAFDPSTTSGVDGYEWQIRGADGIWSPGGTIAGGVRDGDDQVFGYVMIAEDQLYDIRVLALALAGRSDWRTITGVGSAFALTGVITAGVAEVTWVGTTPAVNYAGARIYQTATDTFVSAVLLVSTTPGTTITATGLAAGTGYFWAAPVTLTGAEASPLGPFELTVT